MTLRGYGVLAISVFAGLGSVLFSSNFLLTICAFLFLTLGLAFVWMSSHKGKVSIERSITPEYVYEDSDVLATLNITNVVTQCSIRDYFDNGKKTTRFFVNRIGKGVGAQTQYKFHVDRRGLYTIGPLIVRATDTLGLVAHEYSIPHETQLRVYPKISDIYLTISWA